MLADTTTWIVLVGLIVVIGLLLWKFGSLQKIVTEIGVEIKTASAPAQALGNVVAGVNQSVTSLGSQITQISVQAEKIATLGQRYEEAERLTKDIHSVLIGSYTKGKAGEEMLRRVMVDLIKIGLVKTDQPIRNGVVEYAISFKDSKLLAIDSKVVSTEELAVLFDEKLASEERSRLTDKLRRKVRDKISEVENYIDPPKTLPLAVMAVPDSVMEMVTEVIPEAVARNIILIGYSAVPQLITYFVRIHEFYAIEEDVAALQEKISKAKHEISRLDDKFFQNQFDKPLGTLGRAVNRVKRTASEIAGALAFESGPRDQNVLRLESPEVEKEIPVPVPA
jgi:DNA anti-recombination protein RmuC